MTPQPNQLWKLEGQLFEMLEAREEILTSPELSSDTRPAVLEACEAGISRFVEEKVSEVTEIRASYMALIDAAGVAKAEAQRAQNRAILMQSRADRLKDLIRGCMVALSVQRFDSAMGSFLMRGNGGRQSVTVTDETLVPDSLCTAKITMSWVAWKNLLAMAGVEDGYASNEATRTPRLSAIHDELVAKSCVAGARLEERGISLIIK